VTSNEARDTRSLDMVRKSNARFKILLENQIAQLSRKLDRLVVFVVPVGDAVPRLRELVARAGCESWLRELVAEGKVPGITRQSELFTDVIGHATVTIMDLATNATSPAFTGVLR